MKPIQPVTLFVLAAVALSAQNEVPKFERFRVKETVLGKPALPVLRRAKDQEYRTMIQTAAEKGPNFAGHYTIATWGCGSSCLQGALIDEKTGDIFDLPFTYIGWSPGKFGDGTNGSEQVSFKKDSRLFAFRGCPEEGTERCGAYYYEWTGMMFKLLTKFGFTPGR
jgi:hypothetical protein